MHINSERFGLRIRLCIYLRYCVTRSRQKSDISPARIKVSVKENELSAELSRRYFLYRVKLYIVLIIILWIELFA